MSIDDSIRKSFNEKNNKIRTKSERRKETLRAVTTVSFKQFVLNQSGGR